MEERVSTEVDFVMDEASSRPHAWGAEGGCSLFAVVTDHTQIAPSYTNDRWPNAEGVGTRM